MVDFHPFIFIFKYHWQKCRLYIREIVNKKIRIVQGKVGSLLNQGENALKIAKIRSPIHASVSLWISLFLLVNQLLNKQGILNNIVDFHTVSSKFCYELVKKFQNETILFSGLLFHVVGEAVVNVNSNRADRQTDKENYIDFRLRLLGEPGRQLGSGDKLYNSSSG